MSTYTFEIYVGGKAQTIIRAASPLAAAREFFRFDNGVEAIGFGFEPIA